MNSLKVGISWLIGVVASILVFLGMTVLYMILTKFPGNLWFNLFVFSIVSGVAGAGMFQAAKKLADWIRSLILKT